MKTKSRYSLVAIIVLMLVVLGCNSSKTTLQDEVINDGKKYSPASFSDTTKDTVTIADVNWKKVFSDPNLVALIDTALKNNQELNITLQEIQIAKSEARVRTGEYLPQAGLELGAGMEKPGEFTRDGAVEKQLEVQPGKAFPEPLGDFMIGAYFSWEVDIWKKLRNSKKAAVYRYLASIEGKNFMITNLVAEIAGSYYELVALDNQLEIINKNIEIQSSVLNVVKQQKDAGRVSQLAINRFDAQLLNTQNLQYDIKQQIVETENKINFLVGRFPQPVVRDAATFNDIELDSVYIGIPAQLLENRPDIRKAEQELVAAKLDVKVAKASFYPSLSIRANVGMNAYNPGVWFNPQSLLFNLLGDIVAPLINRNALKANSMSANAKQVQAAYNYQQTILKAYTEVVNQLSGIRNYTSSYNTKSKEVEILNQSVTISNNLFSSARADYMEVLLTQREALQSRMELVEIKLKQMNSKVGVYKALGGGWK